MKASPVAAIYYYSKYEIKPAAPHSIILAASFGNAKTKRHCHVAAVHNTFNVQRHLTSARTHRTFRATAMET